LQQSNHGVHIMNANTLVRMRERKAVSGREEPPTTSSCWKSVVVTGSTVSVKAFTTSESRALDATPAVKSSAFREAVKRVLLLAVAVAMASSEATLD